MTLVAAAAGWGKSTLLAEWALGAQGRVAWLSLDPTDDEPRQFLSYVIEALRAARCLDSGERLDVLSLSRKRSGGTTRRARPGPTHGRGR